MALTKKTTRADKVAANPTKGAAEAQGKDSWKLPTPGAFGSNGTPDLSTETKKWVSLRKKIEAGARLRPRTNSETYTGTRVQYTAYKKKSSTKAHGTPKATETGGKGGKKQVGK